MVLSLGILQNVSTTNENQDVRRRMCSAVRTMNDIGCVKNTVPVAPCKRDSKQQLEI